MAEYIIKVDTSDKEIGRIEKMEAHYTGELHRAFSILVFNSKKQLLLQKRHQEKYHSPGLLSNTCCSHPRFLESLQDAIHRRLKEEMGFDCELSEIFSFTYQVNFDDHLMEHEYDHVFIGFYDGEVIPNKEEVEEYKWVDMNQLKEEMSLNPELYTYWFKCLMARPEIENINL